MPCALTAAPISVAFAAATRDAMRIASYRRLTANGWMKEPEERIKPETRVRSGPLSTLGTSCEVTFTQTAWVPPQ
eukprot:3112280-Pleurochrysis_carterae.AAC.1